MKCLQCSEWFDWNGDDPPEEPICSECISANYEAGLAMHRAAQIHYHKELVVIGKGEFECSGYHQDNRLWDEEITINGADVYCLISDHVAAQIFAEICRRVVSGELEKIEGAAG